MTQSDVSPEMKVVFARMLRKEKRENIIASLVMALTLIAGSYSSYFYGVPRSGVVFGAGATMTLFIILFWLSYFVTRYRMRKGYFGGNVSEAKEVIEFITKNHCT